MPRPKNYSGAQFTALIHAVKHGTSVSEPYKLDFSQDGELNLSNLTIEGKSISSIDKIKINNREVSTLTLFEELLNAVNANQKIIGLYLEKTKISSEAMSILVDKVKNNNSLMSIVAPDQKILDNHVKKTIEDALKANQVKLEEIQKISDKNHEAFVKNPRIAGLSNESLDDLEKIKKENEGIIVKLQDGLGFISRLRMNANELKLSEAALAFHQQRMVYIDLLLNQQKLATILKNESPEKFNKNIEIIQTHILQNNKDRSQALIKKRPRTINIEKSEPQDLMLQSPSPPSPKTPPPKRVKKFEEPVVIEGPEWDQKRAYFEKIGERSYRESRKESPGRSDNEGVNTELMLYRNLSLVIVEDIKKNK